MLLTSLYWIVIFNLSVTSENKYVFTWTLMSSFQLSFTQKQMIKQNTLINFWSSISESRGIGFKLTGPDRSSWLSLFTTIHSTQPLTLHCSWLSKVSHPVLELRSSMNQKLCTHQIIIKNWQISLSAKWLYLKLNTNRTSATLKNI